MESSKSDKFIYGAWLKLLCLYFIMFGLSATIPIVAMYPDLGFPCYFNALVNYTAVNLTQRNVAKHLTPTFFLETYEMFAYISISFFIDCASALYYFVGAYSVFKAKQKHVNRLTSLSQWICLVGAPTQIFLGILRMWTIQLFIHTLSYKHIYLAAFVYTIHFFLSFIYIQCYISRNCKLWNLKVIEQHIPEGTLLEFLVFYIKPIIVNAQLFCLALELLVYSLSLFMAVGNSFYVLVSDIVFGSINMYLGAAFIIFVLIEVLYVKFMKVLFGFHLGVATAAIILALPLLRYEHIFMAAKLQSIISINIICIPILAIVAICVRLTRIYYCYTPAPTLYMPLDKKPVSFEVKKKQNKAKDSKQSAKGPAIMEESTDEDDELI
ncbi:glycoprotein M [Harp seal herpesvirus]|uniref:Glycoprotein M n=1 Tax=phocid gammaherpesvirus 3 TaxID=2560643 RepID=A0A0R5Z8W1_9GAMA|nr:glycoprotein M [Harp seal herpesvirus]AJG42963.1 glycoprotein M [Harp seal herpesvirus]